MRRWSLMAIVSVLAMLGAACGDESDESGDTGAEGGVSLTTTTGGQPTTSAPSGEPVTVDVIATEYAFESSLTTFKVGVPYHFVVQNPGDVEHELMLVEPIAAGTMSMEEMDEMAIAHIEDEDLQAGDTATLDVTFEEPYPAGTLEMACHIEQHYERGMLLPIVVEP
jgi:uncharacterized cupredoxin-like copper-binding protein